MQRAVGPQTELPIQEENTTGSYIVSLYCMTEVS
jgi:hypothetical protein